MGSLKTSLMVTSMIVIGFHFAGLLGATPIGWILSPLLNPDQLSDLAFFTELEGILAAFGAATILAGTVASIAKIEQGATVVFTGLLFLIVWDLVAIWNIIRQTNEILATVLVSPFIIIFLLNVIEWWRGKD